MGQGQVEVQGCRREGAVVSVESQGLGAHGLREGQGQVKGKLKGGIH